MSFLDGLSTKVHDELKALALKHPSYESFMQDIERLGDTMFHNARAQAQADGQLALSQAEGDVKEGVTAAEGDAEKDLGMEPQPASIVGDDIDGANAQGDGGQVTTPAAPASPVSDAGLPTSNVDVIQPSAPPI